MMCTLHRVCCCAFTDDSSMLAAGLEDSQVKVWTISQHKLRSMKSGDELVDLDKESGECCMWCKSRETRKQPAMTNILLCNFFWSYDYLLPDYLLSDYIISEYHTTLRLLCNSQSTYCQNTIPLSDYRATLRLPSLKLSCRSPTTYSQTIMPLSDYLLSDYHATLDKETMWTRTHERPTRKLQPNKS